MNLVPQLGDIAKDEPVLLGFSGGADSVAALLELRERGFEHVVATIVDHRLRAGSASRANEARRIAGDLGAQAHIVQVTPKGGGQAAARQARLHALAKAARLHGARLVVLGHQKDDQAETLMMRLARPSTGLAGLAGISAYAPFPLWPLGAGLMVWRPLLHRSRRSIRDSLRMQGHKWLEDPANEDERFERVRARLQIEEGLRERLCLLGVAASRVEAGYRQLARLLLDDVEWDRSAQGAVLDLQTLAGLPDAVCARLLNAVACGVSGHVEAGFTRCPNRFLVKLHMAGTLTLQHALWRQNRSRLVVEMDPGRRHGRSDQPRTRPLIAVTPLGPVRRGNLVRKPGGGADWIAPELASRCLFTSENST